MRERERERERKQRGKRAKAPNRSQETPKIVPEGAPKTNPTCMKNKVHNGTVVDCKSERFVEAKRSILNIWRKA